MRANALVIFPGGFGTLDEMFEILTLKQTAKISQIPILLFDHSYWRSLLNLDVLVSEGMIAPQDTSLFMFADDAEEAWALLKEHLLCAFSPRQDSP